MLPDYTTPDHLDARGGLEPPSPGPGPGVATAKLPGIIGGGRRSRTPSTLIRTRFSRPLGSPMPVPPFLPSFPLLMVWVGGFEPPSPRSRAACATWLRYTQLLSWRGRRDLNPHSGGGNPVLFQLSYALLVETGGESRTQMT